MIPPYYTPIRLRCWAREQRKLAKIEESDGPHPIARDNGRQHVVVRRGYDPVVGYLASDKRCRRLFTPQCLYSAWWLVYAAPMERLIRHRFLALFLTCVLLGQMAVSGLSWHIAAPPTPSETQAAHCLVTAQHLATPPTAATDTVGGEHLHHCCHATPVSLVVTAVSWPLVVTATLMPAFSADPYRNPLADLLTRPPIT